MSSDFLINVAGLGKDYRIYGRPIDRIREMYSVRRRTYHSVFTALNDVSFDVASGETVGIIGPNGSGKSTLLEMVCGTLTPTRGAVAVSGRLAALLELGAGFNPAFSGRENVYLNAALLGIPREAVEDRFEDIVEFAGIGEFIEHPVSTYSSGMYVRLAFATAVNTDPDILIVDEALAVGDIRFQRKCFRRFQEMQKAGKTILFVTHSVELVQAHCSRALYLKSGELRSLGDPKVVIQDYLEDLFGAEASASSEEASKDAEPSADAGTGGVFATVKHTREIDESQAGNAADAVPGDLCPARAFYNPNEYRWGDKRAVIFDYTLESPEGPVRGGFKTGQVVVLKVFIAFVADIEDGILGFTIKTVDGRTVFGANTRERLVALPKCTAGATAVAQFEFVCSLVSGEYFISIGIAEDDQHRDNVAIDRRYDFIYLPVSGPTADFGIADVGLSIDFRSDD